MPVVNQVPALIRHPFSALLVYAFKYPPPAKTPLPPVGVPVAPEVIVVIVVPIVLVGEPPALGRYLMPVAGQLDLEPSGLVGRKVPV